MNHYGNPYGFPRPGQPLARAACSLQGRGRASPEGRLRAPPSCRPGSAKAEPGQLSVPAAQPAASVDTGETGSPTNKFTEGVDKGLTPDEFK